MSFIEVFTGDKKLFPALALSLISCFFFWLLCAFFCQSLSTIPTIANNAILKLVLALLPFLAFLISLLFSYQFIHRKAILKLFTGNSAFNWKSLFFAFMLWFALNGVSDVILKYCFHGEYSFRPPGLNFIFLILVSFSLLIIQTSCEEIFVRSYLMQLFHSKIKSIWICIVLSSLIFTFLHGANPENEKFGYGIMALNYFTAGLFLAFLVIKTNGLEYSLGIHAATNIYGACIVNIPGGVIQTPSLFSILNANGGILYLMLLCNILIFIYISKKNFNSQNLFQFHA